MCLTKKGFTRAENGKNLDQSKMFLTELLESRCYLTFVVEFNSAVFVIFLLCLYLVQGKRKKLMYRLNVLSAFDILVLLHIVFLLT